MHISAPTCLQRFFLNIQVLGKLPSKGFVAVSSCFKQQLSWNSRVKDETLSGYTAALNQYSYNPEVCLWLTMGVFPLFTHLQPTWLYVRALTLFLPRYGRSNFRLRAFPLFWNMACLILKALLSLLRVGFLWLQFCFYDSKLKWCVLD